MNEINFVFNNCNSDEDLEHCVADVINSGGKVHDFVIEDDKGYVYGHVTGDLKEFYRLFGTTESYSKWEE